MHSPTDAVKSIGLQASAIEGLEVKLKLEALREAAACAGRILLHRERATVGDTENTVEPFW